MKIRPLHLLIVVLLLASAVLAWDAVSTSINPYVSVSEVTRDPAYLDRDVQVLATLDDYAYGEDGSLLLRLTDGNATMTATYRGTPPQGLIADQKIVAIGRLTAPAAMDADQLLVKCPSKYG